MPRTEIIKGLEARLAEVRRRVIVDFWDGTSGDSGHWGTCRLCEWLWSFGEPEMHDAGCPMAEEE